MAKSFEGNTRSREVQNARWRIFIDEMEQGHFSNSLLHESFQGLVRILPCLITQKINLLKDRGSFAIDAPDSSDGISLPYFLPCIK